MTIAYDPHADQRDTADHGGLTGYSSKIAVGMLTLASRRLGRSADSLALPLGLAAQAMQRARDVAVGAQPRIAAVSRGIERSPVLGMPIRRGREALVESMADARARGRVMLAPRRRTPPTASKAPCAGSSAARAC